MHQEVSHFYSFLPNRVAGNGGLLEELWLAESKGLHGDGWMEVGQLQAWPGTAFQGSLVTLQQGWWLLWLFCRCLVNPGLLPVGLVFIWLLSFQRCMLRN